MNALIGCINALIAATRRSERTGSLHERVDRRHECVIGERERSN